MRVLMVLGGAVIPECGGSSKGTGPGAGVPNALLIITQPSATVAARAVLGQSPVIQVIDSKGDPVDAANITVTVTLLGGGTLSGTASVNTDATGKATFNGLSIAGLVGPLGLAYSFTSAPIAKALVDAHKSGVRVQVILDRSQRKERYSSAGFTAHAGRPTYIDAAHAIAHNKVMVIDKAVVITGSFNFTKAAEEKKLHQTRCEDFVRGAAVILEEIL